MLTFKNLLKYYLVYFIELINKSFFPPFSFPSGEIGIFWFAYDV